MERIRVTNLKAGQVYAGSLFTLSGQKLLPAGTPLAESHLAAIRRGGDGEVIEAESVNELAAGGVVKRVSASRLVVGKRVSGGVVSGSGRVLVEAGGSVEEHHIDAARAGGGAYAGDAQRRQRREQLIIDDSLASRVEQEIRLIATHVQTQAQPDWIKPRPAGEWPERGRLIDLRRGHVEFLRKAFARIEAGVAVKAGEFDPIIDDLMQRLAQHPARFTQLALLCPRREDYLPDHAFTVTVLAMAIAAQLQWPRPSVRELALAGVLFDLGMLMVPERIRAGTEQLADTDRARVLKHPIFSLAMLESVEGVPALVRAAALQHHERENGSGYPRGLRRDAICDFARVLAVADAFAAATEPRAYRASKLPYTAMEESLRAASMIVLWKPAVRALLMAAGLFPVGSFVRLSDQRVAHVLCVNPAKPDRPTVQPLDRDGSEQGPPIDLNTAAQLNITRAVLNAEG